MAKILNSSQITTPTYKLIELPDELILNGQIYDKNTFAAKSLDFCPVPSSVKTEIIMSKLCTMNSNANFSRNMNNLVIDNSNPSIYYTFGNGNANVALCGRLYKFTRSATGLQVQSILVSDGTYNSSYEIIQQDSAKIYYVRYRDYEPSTLYFGAIDKATFTAVEAQPGGNRCKILKITDSFIYFMSTYAQNIYFYKYNKNTNSLTLIFTETFTAVQMQVYSHVPSDLTINNEVYIVFDTSFFGLGRNITYRKYTIDFVKEIVTTSNVTIDTSLKATGVPHNLSVSIRVQHEMFFVTDNGKTYVNHIAYWHGATATTAFTADRSVLLTYEVVSGNDWKLISFVDFNPIVYKTIMPLYNNKVLICGYDGGVHFYSWNSGTVSFERISSYDMPPYSIGVDTSNNIYVQLQDTSVEMLSNTLPIQIYADFEYDDYNYIGTDITATLKVYARNFLGNYLTSNLELVLFGPVQFTDTGLKKKTVTTSNLNVLSVPVTITGPGVLRINCKVL